MVKQPGMKALAHLSLLFLAASVCAHEHGALLAGETIQEYANRHMSSEHHIDSFDLRSFFQLHDLNRDGVWDREEIEAIYGVHHVYSQKKSKDDAAHQEKADHIANVVLALLDADKDGKVTPEEFEAVGLAGLPSFDDLGAEGHHYDVESEFFLHHEEQFHSTPETQTDESYTHPEDLEHFAHHESIEHVEAEKEAKFQGISVEEALQAHEPDANPAAPPPPVEPVHHDFGEAPEPQGGVQQPVEVPKPKITRLPPPEKQDPNVRYRDASVEGSREAEWGTGDKGYQSPKNPVEKMRKNLPYKYKFRRNWGDF